MSALVTLAPQNIVTQSPLTSPRTSLSPLTTTPSIMADDATTPVNRKRPSGDGTSPTAANPVDIKNIKSKVGSRDNTRRNPVTSPRKIEPKPSPRFDTVQSKVGSLENIKYKPANKSRRPLDEKLESNSGNRPKFHRHKSMPVLHGSRSTSGSGAEIPTGRKTALMTKSKSPRKVNLNISPPQKPDFSNVKSRVGSLDNIRHKPRRAPPRPIFSEKLTFREQAKPKIPLLTSTSEKEATHTRSLSEKHRSPHIVPSRRLDWSHVTPRVGSKDNIKYKPSGGDIQIFHEKLHWEAEPKVPINERRAARRRAKMLAAMLEELGLTQSPGASLGEIPSGFVEVSAEPKEIDVRSDEGVGSGEEVEEAS